MEGLSQTVEAAIAAIELNLERGEPLLAYNEAQDGLERWPGNARLRQLQALALARSGDIERANALLGALAREGVDDAETLGMLARTHKDLALAATHAARRGAHLDAAFALYESAYARSRREGADDAAWYTGINAATMAVLRRDFVTARRIASEVRQICGRMAGGPSQAQSSSYWREATLGEAALILGDGHAAAGHYARAMSLAQSRYGDVSSTRRQARLLAQHLPGAPGQVAEVLAIPPVVVFTGHMIDGPGRARPRFPAALEASVRDALRRRLEAMAPLAAYGSAACGADLLCLEIAREIGAETHIVLPFPSADFRRASVDFAGGDWGARFDKALACADSVTITSDHHARGSNATFEYANLVLTGMGCLRARMLDAPLRAVAVIDRSDRGAAGGSSSLVSLWQRRGLPVEIVETMQGVGRGCEAPPIKQPAPNGRIAESDPVPVARHEMRAMLFADAVGYSKLSEDQIPGYIAGFLGAVADLSRKTAHRFEHVETSGDGLYMVFRNVADAGHYALELNALTNAFDRAAFGLPGNFDLRVALHCGPVHCAVDPITGSPIYTGPHTSRAARIEPITPPGQVYASSAFAAVAAASGSEFEMRYVGRMPLAKGYGSLGLYHLRSAA